MLPMFSKISGFKYKLILQYQHQQKHVVEPYRSWPYEYGWKLIGMVSEWSYLLKFRISSLFLKIKQFTVESVTEMFCEEDLKACALETAKITHSDEGRVIRILVTSSANYPQIPVMVFARWSLCEICFNNMFHGFLC